MKESRIVAEPGKDRLRYASCLGVGVGALVLSS